MKLNTFHYTVGVLAAFAMVSGCRCGPPQTINSEADLHATPTAVQFNACPTKDEDGNPVPDVFPDEQTISINNDGKVAGSIAALTITGSDPNVKTIFTIDPAKVPASVEGGGSVDVPVHFSPDKKGDITGTLTVDDGNPDTTDVTVSLIGNGINKPSQATAALSFEQTPGQGDFQDCDPSVLTNCTPTYPGTFFTETTTLKFKVKNLGCPTLKITGAEIKPSLLQQAQQQAFTFNDGFVAPTAATPVSLNSADDNSEMTFDIKFSPIDETTDPQQPDDGQRYAILTITTNDPVYPTLDVALTGLGVAPSAYASPTFCNFTDNNDPCGNTSKQQGKAKISIGNGGQQAIKVQSLQFANGGRSGRFTMTGTSAVGATIQPGQTVAQEVSYTDAPVFVSDDLIIQTTDAVNTAQSAGDVKVTFYGGTLPCLSTEPADTLSFEDPQTDLTVKDVVIQNGAGCGTLIVDDVVIDQPNNFFTVVDPKVAAGTQVAAGSSVTAKVQFKKPISGGVQSGVLRVKTNDPAYADPFKVITLYSNAPLNQVPVAILKGPPSTQYPDGQVGQMVISKASIPLNNGKKQIQVNGTASYDPTPSGNVPVSKYQFVVTGTPTSGTVFALTNSANPSETVTAKGVPLVITNDKALLTIDDNVVGEYRIALQVIDSSGQKSSNIDTLKIQVNQ